MQWVLIDLTTIDIYAMVAGTLAYRVAGCAEIICTADIKRHQVNQHPLYCHQQQCVRLH